jgi:nucleoside-diphosphate-sugar epimerase
MESYNDYFRGKKILVTGGLGFIGLNTCARLLKLGAEVTALDNFVPTQITPAFEAVRSRLRLAVADIRDAEKIERVVRDQEVIFNLAGKSGAADSNKTPLNDLDINCRGHLNVLEACRRFNPAVTIIFPSSRLVYGKPLYLPVDEQHPLAPESIYAAHKLAVENYHLIYGKLYGLKVTVLRISNPFGPFQAGEGRAYGIANSFIQAAVSGRPIALFGDGSQLRDYLYIDDLVEALLYSAFAPESRGRIYNIGDGQGTSLLELAEMAVLEAGQGEIVRVPWPEEYRAIETGDYLSDISLARHELGWSPSTGIREGIARTVNSYR